MGRGRRKGREREAQRAGAPPPLRRRLERTAANALIVSLLGMFAVDALPAATDAHAWLQVRVDPVLDVTGLWQGRWNLFAPKPKMVDVHLTAELTYADGSVHRWRSPDWRALGVLERARLFRHMEYYDTVSSGDNRAAWPALARHLARTEGRARTDGALPVRVDLYRHRVRPPPPGDLGPLDRVDGSAGVADPPELILTCWPPP